MEMLVTYLKDDDSVRLLGVYTERYSLERKRDFKAMPRAATLEDVKEFLATNPLPFCEHFRTEVTTDLDEESFVLKFGEKLKTSVRDFGDDKALAALSMGRSK